tara:strand:- start:228 stop:506 length:279 start_codon:yes stop_codon:yes gene_type:complete
MTDVIIFDQLADIKRLTNDKAFQTLDERFQKEKSRYLGKLLDPSTPADETLALKAVVNALESLSPLSIAETVLKIEVKNRKVANPEMFKPRR